MSTTQRKDDSPLLTGLGTCQLKAQEDQQQQEKHVIAQPIFVFEKGEHTFKRPAEDRLDEAAEHEFNGFSRKRIRSSSVTLHTTDSQALGVAASSQTRLRSSSFTDVPTFPPSGPVRKNNVFMTSSLVQRNIDMNSIEQGPVRPSEHVLRPATLQPPQVQSCEHLSKTSGPGASKPCKLKENTKHKVSEANSSLLSENLSNARSSAQLSTDLQVSEATSGCQPKEDTCSFKSCSSDFVFGENMVERVLGTQRLTQPPLQNHSYAKEKTFKSVLKFPTAASDPIMHNQGNLRLVLNSRLWTQMKVQRANHKNLQITATDLEGNGIKVFLIQASAKDIGYLYAAIHHRLVALRSLRKQAEGDPAESPSDTVLQQFSCDEDEDDFIQVTKNGSDPSRWNHRQSVVCS
ncbi:ran-binding protein 3-like isoform X2 [Peromyscus maniculatus bairdii]|uniref:ran-binding protein 3-like isoform X2 n=1 Tax=Peromyscus maniculatus bairdii TaxID=230844 RepID=UPI001C2E2DD9|nr:ran-binding protein 3-like isoform X3 [Peromyscus maniculatus bairdii]